MSKRAVFLLCCASMLVACGGGQGEADSAADLEGAGSEDGAGDEGGGDETKPPAPADGIVRDADGDGIPDNEEASGCEGKTETECKINMDCAWSDDGKCVQAKAGM
jgi:hypothetical protein